jgi:hypothetical protein
MISNEIKSITKIVPTTTTKKAQDWMASLLNFFQSSKEYQFFSNYSRELKSREPFL